MAAAGLPAILSYAGRVAVPRAQPVATRIGGFGGAGGLAQWLQDAGIGRVIDATHPFAAQISGHAVAACAQTGTPLIALERAAWAAGLGDAWHHVPDMAAAAGALAGPRRRVFLAIGRQQLDAFAGQMQHHYLLRLVDRPAAPLALHDAHVVIARGPFDATGDADLLRAHAIDVIVAKNAGGAGAEAKLIAARALGLAVIMVDRPAVAARRVVATVGAAMDWLHADLGV